MIRDRKTNDRITEIFEGASRRFTLPTDTTVRPPRRGRRGVPRPQPAPHGREEEYCYFLAVTFPASQLRIIDYNRVVKDLNGLTPAEFLERLKEDFTVEEKGTEIYRPQALHNFSMYLEGRWYSPHGQAGNLRRPRPDRRARRYGALEPGVLTAFWISRTSGPRSASTSWAASAAWAS